MGRVKGEAKVYRLKNNEHYQQDYTEKTEYIHWPILDWHPEFRRLDKRKREILESDEENPYVHKDDITDIKKSVRKEERKKTEQEIIERMSSLDFTQTEIAEALEYNQATISRRLNNDA